MRKDEDTRGLHDNGRGHHATPKHMEEKEETDEENPKASICCLQGCLAATAVGFSFFVALPTGILLVIYASNKDDVPLLSVGGVLVSLPIIMLLIVIVLCFNQRRLARLGNNRVTSAINRSRKKETAASLSSSSSSSSSSPSSSSTVTLSKTAAACESGLREERVVGEGGAGIVMETERF